MENRPPARPAPPSGQNIKGHLIAGANDSERNLRKIKQYHDEAYLYIEQGLTCDEKGQKEQAVTLYSKGLHCFDLAFDVPNHMNHGPECVETEWQKANNLLLKMQRTKQQIQTRVEKLISTDPGVAHALDDPPPSYEQATSPTRTDFDMVLEASLINDQISNGQYHSQTSSASAVELYQIEDGVQIFFITKEGYVSAPSYPSSLGIYKFNESLVGVGGGASNNEVAQVFLRVGEWTYPLIAGRSPVLQATWGAYIFPDVTASGDGNSVGVIIPDYVSPPQRARFEHVLRTYTDMRNQEQSPSVEERHLTDHRSGQCVLAPGGDSGQQVEINDERTSVKISRGLETAAEWITWGLMKGAEKTGELMKKGSTKLQERITPDETATKIDPATQKGVYYTRKATEGVVKVSGFVVSKIGQGSMALARMAAPHLRKQGEKYLPKSFVEKDSGGKSKLDDVATVAAGGLKSWATMYVGLEQAAKVLATNITRETVHVVKHKYGNEAGNVTEDAMHAGANVVLSVHNTTNMGATAIAKRAAKNTGQAVVEHGAKNNKRAKANENVVDKSIELR